MNKPQVLFLADTTHHTGAVKDHINAVICNKNISWQVLNPLVIKTVDKLDFSWFDAIGVHYSVKPYTQYYLSRLLKKKLADYQGIKFLFLQDEYQKVNEVQDFLYKTGFHLLFTLVNDKLLHKAYPDPRLQNMKKISVLTGFVSDEMKKIHSPPVSERRIDVSYRSRRCNYWLGSLAYEKQLIATEFVSRAQTQELVIDISLEESDRVYGEDWVNLLKNSKAVLGTESGASIWDFDGTVERKTNAFLKKNRKASFEQVYQNVLKPYDGNIAYSAISPRIFEAAATRTAMILFPGEYSGVCKPDVHYMVLEKDFSNFKEVLFRLKNQDYLQAMADRTWQDLISSDRYSQQQFSDRVVLELLALIKPKNLCSNIPERICEHQKKHKLLNAYRQFTTELLFAGGNFFQLLFDSKYSIYCRLQMLGKGLKRYFVYLLPRLK